MEAIMINLGDDGLGRIEIDKNKDNINSMNLEIFYQDLTGTPQRIFVSGRANIEALDNALHSAIVQAEDMED